MGATPGEEGEGGLGDWRGKASDAETTEIVKQETKVEISIAGKHKTRAGGSFFPYLNTTIFDLPKYDISTSVDTNNYKHNCLYLALQPGGLSYIKVKELISTLGSRHVHKCDLLNVCNTLETHIELISLRSNGGSRVEHYGNDVDEQCNLGLTKGQYFLNGYTELTSYCLGHYEEVNDVKYCNNIFKTYNDKYKKCNGRFVKALQVFKLLMGTVDKVNIPIELTDEVLTTQFCDKVCDFKTLQYNVKDADQSM